LTEACEEYKIQWDSLNSLLRNTHVSHVKKITRHIKSMITTKHAESYVVRGKYIVQIAKENKYPPYLMARAMIEVLLVVNNNDSHRHQENNNKNDDGSGSSRRKGLTEAMRDPVLKLGHASVLSERYRESERHPGPPPPPSDDEKKNPSLSRICREVIHAINLDPMYGPIHDETRHRIGNKYEELLVKILESMDIPFDTEYELRKKGTARTPDVLLLTPVAVQDSSENWRVVCWIDSKALFGDDRTHRDSVIPQAESYIHRFGPGLILYWFGHAPDLDDSQGDITICGWKLPEQILLPTGEMAVQKKDLE